jgi:GDP-D-mannose 3', 5'-epimerase
MKAGELLINLQLSKIAFGDIMESLKSQIDQIDNDELVLVTGAGGFIGGHLIADLRKKGFRRLRAIDIKPFGSWCQIFPDVQNLSLDLRDKSACYQATQGAVYIFNLAADMGGMGYIETHKANCMLSVLINTHMLLAARDMGVKRYLFTSSACVYAAEKQKSTNVEALKENDAYPAMPEDGYGWEKLFSERMCRHFWEDFGLPTTVVRLHNVYGPFGSFDGGREKAPAAICRKVITAKLSGKHEIEIWGDGEQTRSFMYIDDCIYGLEAIMASTISGPINLGSNELISINQVASIAEEIGQLRLERRFNLDAPKGVRGRNSDNALLRKHLNWEPSTRFRDGLEKTYNWIHKEMLEHYSDSHFTEKMHVAPQASPHFEKTQRNQ